MISTLFFFVVVSSISNVFHTRLNILPARGTLLCKHYFTIYYRNMFDCNTIDKYSLKDAIKSFHYFEVFGDGLRVASQLLDSISILIWLSSRFGFLFFCFFVFSQNYATDSQANSCESNEGNVDR